MKKLERILIMLVVIGIICKLFTVADNNILITCAMGTLSFIYIYGGVYFFSGATFKQQSYSISILSGIFFGIIPLGVLFKIQRWPGAGFSLLLGIVTTFILLLVIYFFKRKSSENLREYYKNIFVRGVVLFCIGFMLFMTPGKYIIAVEYRNDPEGARVMENVYYHPDNEQYRKDLEQYYRKH